MTKPYDASLKDLLEAYPADWLPLAGQQATGRVEVIDADLATVTAAADKVLRVLDPEPWLLHWELQSSPKTDLDEGLHWYNGLLRHRHQLRVRSVVVLLRPAADLPILTGLYQEAFPGEEPYLRFRYQVVRLWQIPAAQLLAGGLGLLPLAPLGAVSEAALPGVIRQMQQRLEQEVSPAKAQVLWATTYILMGLRYPEELITQLLRGVRTMKESVTYQAILREGREEGLKEGALAEVKKVLLRQGRKRFGPPAKATKAALQAITSLPRLERLSERLLDVSSWDELLAER